MKKLQLIIIFVKFFFVIDTLEAFSESNPFFKFPFSAYLKGNKRAKSHLVHTLQNSQPDRFHVVAHYLLGQQAKTPKKAFSSYKKGLEQLSKVDIPPEEKGYYEALEQRFRLELAKLDPTTDWLSSCPPSEEGLLFRAHQFHMQGLVNEALNELDRIPCTPRLLFKKGLLTFEVGEENATLNHLNQVDPFLLPIEEQFFFWELFSHVYEAKKDPKNALKTLSRALHAPAPEPDRQAAKQRRLLIMKEIGK